jgi:serine/threonine protein kinase
VKVTVEGATLVYSSFDTERREGAVNAGSIGTLIVAHARSRTHIREAMVRNVFRQMSKALEYCHCGPENIRRDWTPIIHKDIKPGSYVCFEDYTILI